jgi:hypothetical protein
MVQGFLNKGTGLNGQGADDGGDDGADNLQHLEYFLPVDFHFTQNKFKRNTLLIKGHTDFTDYTDFFSTDNIREGIIRIAN